MLELTENVNWLAVLIGFALSFGLAYLWFSPRLFGKAWAASLGITLESDAKPPMGALLMQALGTFGFAWLVGITAASNHLLTIILVALTIVLLVAASGKFARHGTTGVLIEAGFNVTITIIMILVHAVI